MDPCFQLCIYKQTIQPKITKTSCHHLFGNGREDKYPEESKFNASYLVKLRKP